MNPATKSAASKAMVRSVSSSDNLLDSPGTDKDAGRRCRSTSSDGLGTARAYGNILSRASPRLRQSCRHSGGVIAILAVDVDDAVDVDGDADANFGDDVGCWGWC